MKRSLLPRRLTALLVGAALLSFFSPVPAQSEGEAAVVPMTKLLPGNTLLLVHSLGGASLLDDLVASGAPERFTETDAWKEFLASEDGKELNQGLTYLTLQTGLQPLDLARALLDGETALAVVPVAHEKEPQPLLISRPRQPEVLRKLLDAVTFLAGQAVEKVSHKGVEAQVINGTVFFWENDTFVLGRDRALLESTIDRLRGDTGGSIADGATRDSVQAITSLGPIAAFLDVDRLRSMQGGTLEALEAPSPEPLSSLLFGGYRQLLKDSKSISMGLSWRGEGLQLRGVAKPANAEAGHDCYFPKKPSRGIPKPVETIASMLVQRNLESWWAARLDLVGEAAHAAMSNFANDIGNILGGRDFGEEILGLAANGLELFVIAPKEAVEGVKVPEPLLPGFALAVPLSTDAERPSPTLQAMFQTFISFINIDGAANDRGPMLLGSREHRGVTITRAAPILPADDRDLGIEYNFVPSIAVADGMLYLASNDHAVEKLLDARAESGAGGEPADANAALQLDGARLKAILETNRLALIANSVLEGKSMEEAVAEMHALFELLGLIESVAMRLEPNSASNTLELTVDLELAVPKTKQEEF